MQMLIAYIAVVVALSATTFFVYGYDKYRARAGRYRVPEKTLHLLALFGGWPGAWAGQQVFHHKTQKGSFQVVFWLCVVVNLMATFGVGYIFLVLRGG